jgi:hypothetical protein
MRNYATATPSPKAVPTRTNQRTINNGDTGWRRFDTTSRGNWNKPDNAPNTRMIESVATLSTKPET